MTVSVESVHGGIFGIIPERCESEIGIITLPGQDQDYVHQQLDHIIGDVEIDWPHFQEAFLSPVNNKYFNIISDTLRNLIGNYPVVPFILPAPSDSKYFREIGIPSYGIPQLTLDPMALGAVHGKNEKKDVNSLRLESDLLINLAQNYLCS